MPENVLCNGCDDCYPNDKIKESVCINAPRIYDSCSDKDCLEDLPVLLTKPVQCMVDKAVNVRLHDADVCNVSIDLQPVPFHRGFYSVDMVFYFDLCLDLFMAPNAMPMPVKALSVYSKRVVLFGSDGNVKVFTSDCPSDMSDGLTSCSRNCPKATVQIAEPVPLSARLCEHKKPCDISCHIPKCISERYGGEFSPDDAKKDVYVSIGIFTIVQLERNVQMLIPAYDFCIPHKECVTTSENPCELFSTIAFPTNDFFPKNYPCSEPKYHCGCDKDK
ncbi:MAG: hypothetical protein PUG48_10875 [Clostridia bacterium]|nr:hypothetical protein [Clostridia bacterium]